MVIKATIIANDHLDYCECTANGFYSCKFCYNVIVEKMIPKFGSANYINVLLCPKYPDIFSNLTSVEKTFIASANFVMSVIKLRPNEKGLTSLYYWIRDYMVMLSHNSRPLLIILSLSN